MTRTNLIRYREALAKVDVSEAFDVIKEEFGSPDYLKVIAYIKATLDAQKLHRKVHKVLYFVFGAAVTLGFGLIVKVFS